MEKKLKDAVEFIRSKTDIVPEIALILGSGLGAIADEVVEAVKIPYDKIPGFSAAKVHGHAGQLVIGKLNDRNVVAMQGRFHYYEGHPMTTVVFPVRVMKMLGANIMIVTNAAGGVNTSFTPGDLMIIDDHINAMCNNPLMGENIDFLGPRFPDMSYAYCREFIMLVEKIANDSGYKITKGVYYGSSGPSYETPAEIRMIRNLGGDAVGMSTVPEVITANHMGMKVLGISCITNMAAGVLPQPLSHEEVIET
ncbi:MAG: purine-nucleoside phosphorylase, partial [Cyanobacteriota bacterium]